MEIIVNEYSNIEKEHFPSEKQFIEAHTSLNIFSFSSIEHPTFFSENDNNDSNIQNPYFLSEKEATLENFPKMTLTSEKVINIVDNMNPSIEYSIFLSKNKCTPKIVSTNSID